MPRAMFSLVGPIREVKHHGKSFKYPSYQAALRCIAPWGIAVAKDHGGRFTRYPFHDIQAWA
jgi:hypothetical protein